MFFSIWEKGQCSRVHQCGHFLWGRKVVKWQSSMDESYPGDASTEFVKQDFRFAQVTLRDQPQAHFQLFKFEKLKYLHLICHQMSLPIDRNRCKSGQRRPITNQCFSFLPANQLEAPTISTYAGIHLFFFVSHAKQKSSLRYSR